MAFFKKNIFLKVGIFISSFFISANAISVPLPKSPEIKADSYILMDYDTGEILLSENPDKIYPPASLTKLMTAYTVLREIDRKVITIEDNVKISKNAFFTAKNTDSARMFLEINDVVPMTEMLKGLIVHSGNDAAIALAEHVAGTEENFATLMNHYAKELGMKNTLFKNASGLPKKNHYTTSKDLAILMKSMIDKFPEEYKYYFSMREYEYNDINQPSRNKLLFRDVNVEGGKTGWTTTADYCYIASFYSNGRRLIVSTLKSPNPTSRFEDAVALSHYGFKYFENYHIVNKGISIEGIDKLPVYKANKTNVNIVPESSIKLTLPTGTFDDLKVFIDIEDKLLAPIKKGDVVGVVKIHRNDKEISRSYLITDEDIPEGSWYQVFLDEVALKMNF